MSPIPSTCMHFRLGYKVANVVKKNRCLGHISPPRIEINNFSWANMSFAYVYKWLHYNGLDKIWGELLAMGTYDDSSWLNYRQFYTECWPETVSLLLRTHFSVIHSNQGTVTVTQILSISDWAGVIWGLIGQEVTYSQSRAIGFCFHFFICSQCYVNSVEGQQPLSTGAGNTGQYWGVVGQELEHLTENYVWGKVFWQHWQLCIPVWIYLSILLRRSQLQ